MSAHLRPELPSHPTPKPPGHVHLVRPLPSRLLLILALWDVVLANALAYRGFFTEAHQLRELAQPHE